MPSRIELSPFFASNGPGTMSNRIMISTPPGFHVPILGGLLFKHHHIRSYTEGNNGDFGGSVLTIMKGTPPASISQITPTMAYSELNARPTDTLLAFESNYDHFSSSQYQVNPVIISTIFIPSIATGTATWFWLRNWSGYAEAGHPARIGQSVIGTVGLLGSGADLEMADVNILSGDNYRISAMKLEFPTSWEF